MRMLTVLLCVAATTAWAQNRTVKGTVIGPDNAPVIGATVFATDGKNVHAILAGTTTDYNGQYSLSIPANAAEITVEFIGYETETAKIGGGDFCL